MINLLSAVCEQLSVWGQEQTAEFKREYTANLENETKPDNLEKESNDQFCERPSCRQNVFLRKKRLGLIIE